MSENEWRDEAARLGVENGDLQSTIAGLKARIGELEEQNTMARGVTALAGIGIDGHQMSVKALKSTTAKLIACEARAERAEAEADSLRATINNMRAMNIKLTFEATGKVLAAEAERDAMREALELTLPHINDDAVFRKARAALNPYGRVANAYDQASDHE